MKLNHRTIYPIEIRLSQIQQTNEDNTEDHHSVVDLGSARVDSQNQPVTTEAVDLLDDHDAFSCGKSQA